MAAHKNEETQMSPFLPAMLCHLTQHFVVFHFILQVIVVNVKLANIWLYNLYENP